MLKLLVQSKRELLMLDSPWYRLTLVVSRRRGGGHGSHLHTSQGYVHAIELKTLPLRRSTALAQTLSPRADSSRRPPALSKFTRSAPRILLHPPQACPCES